MVKIRQIYIESVLKMKKIGILFVGLCFIVSCSGGMEDLASKDKLDRYGKLSRDDYKDQLVPESKPITKIETKAPPIPKVQDVLMKPQPPKLGVNKIVSLSITEDVPLKDVFIELSRLADIDIEVDPGIEGGVIFKAKDKPFSEVVERLADLAGLKYSMEGGTLRIERDLPYIENYPVNFINMVRSSSGGMNVSADILSAGSVTGDGVTSGSNNDITVTADGDIWASVETGLAAIIAGEEGENNFVDINRQASLVTVRTNAANHERVNAYLNYVKTFYAQQVLIEAKIVEVQLADQFRSGIDWSFVDGTANQGIVINSGYTGGNPIADAVNNITTIAFGRSDGDITGAIELAEVFGTTRTLSSPRIMALNNQAAVLTFVRNKIYFDIELEEEEEEDDSGTTTTTLNISSSPIAIPIGVILNMQAMIDTKNNEVIMNVRPTLSRLFGDGVPDPQVALLARSFGVEDTIQNIVPEVEVREMDSIFRIRNGEVLAIGGMIEERTENTDSGLPYVSDIPLLGNAFKSVDKETVAVQTVIFLKATIVPSYGVDELDQNFYNKFTNDPRPLKF